MLGRIVAGIIAVACMGGAYKLDQAVANAPSPKTACDTAIAQGYYTEDLRDQCLNDFTDYLGD